jgi:hypothetical protein
MKQAVKFLWQSDASGRGAVRRVARSGNTEAIVSHQEPEMEGATPGRPPPPHLVYATLSDQFPSGTARSSHQMPL